MIKVLYCAYSNNSDSDNIMGKEENEKYIGVGRRLQTEKVGYH